MVLLTKEKMISFEGAQPLPASRDVETEISLQTIKVSSRLTLSGLMPTIARSVLLMVECPAKKARVADRGSRIGSAYAE